MIDHTKNTKSKINSCCISALQYRALQLSSHCHKVSTFALASISRAAGSRGQRTASFETCISASEQNWL